MEQILVLIAPMVASKLTQVMKNAGAVDGLSKTKRVWALRLLLGILSIAYIFVSYLITGSLDGSGIEVAVEGILSALVAGFVYAKGKEK